MKKEAVSRRSAYKLPEVYDLAFSYRSFSDEVAQLLRWYRQFASRHLPRRAIEFAAGPARHAIRLAQYGVSASAVDCSPEMCRYAIQSARDNRVDLRVALSDIVRFRTALRYDLAFTMLDSIAHLHSETQLIRHLRSAARLLTTNGIYVLEVAGTQRARDNTVWTVTDKQQSVQVRWQSNAKGKPASSKIKDTIVQFRWTTREGIRFFEQHLARRRWRQDELFDCVRAAGHLRVVGEFGGLNTRMRADSRRATRRVVVLQRCA